MNSLNSFAKFLNESDSDKYYYEVSIDEFKNKGDINIEMLYRQIYLLLYDSVSDFSDFHLYNNMITFNKLSNNIPVMSVDIYLSNDEWFKVSIFKFWTPEMKSNQLFYFCDQFDGLKKLLVDKSIIK